MNRKLAIVGAGGHGKVVGEIALLNQYETRNFFDDKEKDINEFPFTISGSLDYLKQHLTDYDDFFVAIGDNQSRFNFIEWFKKQKMNIVSLVHPNSTVSKFSSVGVGTCIMANAVINPGTKIKDGVIINTCASIDHDCVIGEFSHISPNCSLSGSVKVGKFSHLGTGTSVHPGIDIGNSVRIAIGSKIYKNILDDTVLKN